MPSSFFSCSRLTELSLSKCELDPPRKFRGFPNLTKVELVNVSIIADITFGSQVSRWELSRCSGIEHLECQFKHTDNLCTLVIVDSRKCDWEWFRFTSVSYGLVLVRLKPVSNVKKIISLDELLVNICHIYTLELCGSTIECLEPGRKSPATPMKNLKYLVFYDLKLSELRQISNAYNLIRSSPNLQHLTTHLVHKAAMDSANESYLASPHCMNRILDRLQSIEIHGVVGSISELHLIKFLLASSRTLKTITLKHEKTIFDPKTELEIIKKLLRLPRASATAEMIWT